jgi:hypothetical protein
MAYDPVFNRAQQIDARSVQTRKLRLERCTIHVRKEVERRTGINVGNCGNQLVVQTSKK